ncbi:lipopolysaccharide heptosyltransferase II [Spiribacter vilamensis]|nr:lipopolysaccharide heptosyltransferase II [Spiribacter vilamensis]
MVMAQSLFKALREQAPDRPVDVVAPPWGQALLERMPEVRHTFTLPVPHGEFGLSRRWSLGQALKRLGHSQAIVLPRSAKAALVPWLARIPKRTGYLGEHRYGLLNDIRPLDRQSTYRTVDRFVALGDPNGSEFGTGTNQPTIQPPALTTSRDQQQATLETLGIADKFGTGTILTLCPGAEYGPAKRWPAASFAALANRYLERGCQVVLLGSDKDSELTRDIAAAAPGVLDLAGQTTLSQAIDLLAASSVVVTNDSGLMHIAAATSAPVIALYGSSDPQYTPPLSDRAEIIYRGLECSPCFQRHCPLGHLNCLRGITPDHVTHMIDQQLGQIA